MAGYTRLALATPTPPAEVVSRAEWASANLDVAGAASSTRWPSGWTSGSRSRGRWPAHCGSGASATVAAEAGLVMGYLSSRVLGQYDVSLLGGDAEPRLLFVGPNLAGAVRDLDVDADAFGRWICAHELTHVFQFQGVPWLREHMGGLLRRYLATLEVRIESGVGGRAAVAADPRPARGGVPRGRARGARADPRTAGIDGRDSGGHVGRRGLLRARDGLRRGEVIPDHEQLREAMDRRRRSRSAPQRIIERLLGFDVKLRQYEQGKEFATRWSALAGIEGLNRVLGVPGGAAERRRAAASRAVARTHRACAPAPPEPRRLASRSALVLCDAHV